MASASNSVSNSTRDLLSLGNVSNMSHSDADLSEAWRQVYASTKLTEAAAACCFSDLDAMLFVPCSKYQLEPKVDMDDGTIEVEGNYVDLCRFSVHIWSSQSGKSSPAPPKQPLPKRESPTKFLPSPTSDPEDPYGTTPFASNPAAEADSLSSSRFSSRSFRTKASTLHYVQEKLAGQLSEIETAHHVRILALPGEDPAEAIVTINAADTGKAQVDKGYSEVTDFVNAVSQQLVELKIDVPREVEAEARTKCDDLLRGSTNSVVMDIDDTGRAVTLIGGRDDVADAAAKVERLIWNLRSRSPREPLKLTAEGIVVKQADIVREKADVFLVTTSVGAFMTSGLSQRVIAEAGGEVGLACAEEIKKSGGKIKPRLFVTSGGQLPCNYIIHMIFPNNFQAKSAVPLKQTYFSGLELAGSAKLKARSVAIPCPDSIPLVACSTPIPYAVNQYMEAMGEASTVKQVVFVCENASTMMAFKRGLESLRPVQKGSPKSLSKAPAPAPAPAAEAMAKGSETAADETEDECIICFKSITNKTYLPCAHGFCGGCIADWLKRQTKCPVCDLPVFADHLSYSSGNSAAMAAKKNCAICLNPAATPKQLSCGDVFCKRCIDERPSCPICGKALSVFPGSSMRIARARNTLSGFPKCGTICIQYDIPAGIQSVDHPNPGMSYAKTVKTAYLPDNIEGKAIVRMLRKAFDAGLMFKIGKSKTSGLDNQIVWGEIEHKTNKTGGEEGFGYPDPGYLSRVRDKLLIKL